MANLIEQMNILKGLDDASLQGEIQSPSGAAPPFLVLTEINRRKDMRQRYEGEQARKKPSTTVVEDVAFGMPAVPASVPAAMPGGLDAAAGMPPQGFASGGLVEAAGYAEGGAVNYDDIAKRYNDRLTGLDSDKKRARAMALLAASGAMLGGGSSNTLKNVGAGIGAFAGSYGDQLKGIDSQELELLRGISNVGQAQSQMDIAALDQDFRERQLASQERQAAARMDFDKKPAAVVAAEWYNDPNTTDEERAAYDRNNYDPNRLNQDQLLGAKVDAIYQDAQKKYPPPQFELAGQPTAADQQAKAQAEAYNRIKAAYGAVVANEWLAGMGLDPNDVLVGGTPGAATTGVTSDGAIGFEEYFKD